MDYVWQLQQAKNRLSEVVDAAIHDGPQVITRRGTETAVVLSYADYGKLLVDRGSLTDFFRNSPLVGVDLDLSRDETDQGSPHRMRYLLDTNVISELVSKRPDPAVLDWIDSLEPGAIFVSVITIGELQKGVEKLPDSSRKERLLAWLHADLLVRFQGRILDVDVSAMLTWGSLVARMERAGRPLPAMDSLIAALALRHNCVLVTRDEGRFAHTGAQVANPWSA